MDDFSALRLREATHFASLRCMSLGQLAKIVADVSARDHHAALRILRERDLSSSEQALVATTVAPSLTLGYRDGLPRSMRSRADRLLRNVGTCLPEDVARFWISVSLAGRLAARRRAALNLLRYIGVTQQEVALLLQNALSVGDVESIELLCRSDYSIPSYLCCQLVGIAEAADVINDVYVASLVLARLWADDRLDHDHASQRHECAYVRAMGRVADRSRRARLVEICSRSDHVQTLILAASVAGRLDVPEVVRILEHRFEDSYERS